MAISVICDCGNRLLLNEGFVGQQVRCPYCDRLVLVEGERVSANPRPAADPGPRIPAYGNRDLPGYLRERAPNTIPAIGTHPMLFVVQLATILSASGAVLAAGFYRLDGMSYAILSAGIGALAAIAALFVAGFNQLPFLAPLVALVFCASISGLALSESEKKVLAEIFPNWLGADILDDSAEARRPVFPADVPARIDNFEVRLLWAKIARPLVRDIYDVDTPPKPFPTPGLLVMLEFRNIHPSSQIEYKNVRINVSDNLKNYYKYANIGTLQLFDREVVDRELLPGQKLTDLFFFERPLPSAEYVDVNIGMGFLETDRGAGISIRIPASEIRDETGAAYDAEPEFGPIADPGAPDAPR